MRERLIRLAASALLFAAISAPARAVELRCPGTSARVEAGAVADARLACAALQDARDLFESCGLAPTSGPSLSVVDAIDGPGDCLALYHCAPDRIEVLTAAMLEDAVLPDSPLAAIPRERLFSSLIVHELAHAVFYEATQGEARGVVDHEYVAFALQLESLREEDRRAWLDAYPGEAAPRRNEISGFLAVADPLRFAAKAWRHFASPGQGCASVRDVMAGRRTFSLGRY